jgi:nucleoside-diphosphate-sugar epimerase
VAAQTFAWVHVEDLAALVADLATGAIEDSDDAGRGPVPGGCTPVNVAGGPATHRDYLGTVAGALGVEPEWRDEPAWTGQVRADRARRWGWAPRVDLAEALRELEDGLRR